MAETSNAIGLDQNVGELGLTNPAEDPAADLIRGRILDVGLDLGDDEMPILDAEWLSDRI